MAGHLFRTLMLLVMCVLPAQASFAAGPAAPQEKNWVAPVYKIHAQTLIEGLMRNNPGLLSVTFHGTPPGQKGVYTMFAGSWPDRIGKVSAADDIMVIESGFTILDPRWNKHDPEPKFLVLLPLRDKSGSNVGCIVFGFRNPAGSARTDQSFLREANALRDGLKSQIADHGALFAPARTGNEKLPSSTPSSWLILSVPEGEQAPVSLVESGTSTLTGTPWVRSIKGKGPSGFERLSSLGFPDGKAREAWRTDHAPQLKAPMLVKPARLLIGSGRGASHSAKSVFKISYYTLSAPVSEFQDWVDGYLSKYLRVQESAGILSSYAMYLEEGAAGRALLVLEYPDAATEASAEPIKEKLSDELAATDAAYAAQMKKKEKVRTTQSWALAVPVAAD